tara:strand:+ start:297 stop:707 length:411 start_codon:yes stop_codon:yes gene_type:complete
MPNTSLIPIGSVIAIDKIKISSRLLKEKSKNIIDYNDYKIVEYKITDGGEIGYIIEAGNSTLWIFNDELSDKTIKEYSIEIKGNNQPLINTGSNTFERIFNLKKMRITVNGSTEIKSMMNPFFFFKWLLYSSKDVF